MSSLQFCPECSSLLRKKKMGEKFILACKCGYKEDTEIDKREIEAKIQKKKEELAKNVIIVSKKDQIITNPITNETCPKCKNEKAECWQEQTRSADEPSTSFFRCTKCKFTWREY